MDHLFTLLICLAASTNSLWIPPNCTPLFLCQSTLSRLLLWLSFALFSLCSLTNDETLKDEEMQTALYELFRSLKLANWLWKPFLLTVVPLLRKKKGLYRAGQTSYLWLRFLSPLVFTKGNTDFFFFSFYYFKTSFSSKKKWIIAMKFFQVHNSHSRF